MCGTIVKIWRQSIVWRGECHVTLKMARHGVEVLVPLCALTPGIGICGHRRLYQPAEEPSPIYRRLMYLKYGSDPFELWRTRIISRHCQLGWFGQTSAQQFLMWHFMFHRSVNFLFVREQHFCQIYLFAYGSTCLVCVFKSNWGQIGFCAWSIGYRILYDTIFFYSSGVQKIIDDQ